MAFYLGLGPFRTKRVYKLRTTGAIFDRSTAKGKGVGVSGFYEGDCDSRLYWRERHRERSRSIKKNHHITESLLDIVLYSFPLPSTQQKWETQPNLIKTTCSLFCHFETALNDSLERDPMFILHPSCSQLVLVEREK